MWPIPSGQCLSFSLPDTEWIEMVGPVAGIEAVAWDIVAEPPRRDEIALVVPPYIGDRAPLRRLAMLPSLRAVQLLTAGYDDVLPLLPPGVTLANAAGVHDASTAELAVGLALAALRGVPDMVRAQDRAVVPLGGRPALADKRVLILGYGSIGRAARPPAHGLRGRRSPRSPHGRAPGTTWCRGCTASTSCPACCRTTTSWW